MHGSVDLDVRLLRTFVTLIETGSFSETAKRVGRTQPAISMQLKRLEEHLGHPLLLRDRKVALPTQQGRVFLGYARRILELNDEVVREIANAPSGSKVRVGAQAEFAQSFLERVLMAMRRSHPQLQLEIRFGLSAALIHEYEEGRLDLVLAKTVLPRTDALVYWPEHLTWACSSSFELDRGGRLPLVVLPKGSIQRRLSLELCSNAVWEGEIACDCTNWTDLCHAVECGYGVAVLPRSRVGPGMRVLSEDDGMPSLPSVYFNLLCHGAAPVPALELADRIRAELDLELSGGPANAARLSRRAGHDADEEVGPAVMPPCE